MLGISTSYFATQGFGIYDSVAEAQKMGFSLVELGAAHQFEKNILETLRRIKRDFAGTKFVLHCPFPPMKKKFWFNTAEGLTPLNKKTLENLFFAAEFLEAELVSFHPGFKNKALWGKKLDGIDFVRYGRAIPLNRAFENSFKVFGFAQNLSEKTGIGFAIENITKGKLEKPLFASKSDFEKAFSKFPSCGFLLDFGHALFCRNLEEMLEMKEKIKQVHLHYSRPESTGGAYDDHAPIVSESQIAPLLEIRQLKKIPVIFEHHGKIPRQRVEKEKKICEGLFDCCTN